MKDKKEVRILKTANRMFGLSSMDSIFKEREDIFYRMKRMVDSEDGMSLMTDKDFLDMYSRYITLDKLCKSYMEDKR